MIEFLFDGERFVPRGHCGQWNDSFKAIYIVANLFIVAAYIAIPLVLLKFRFTWKTVAQSVPLRIGFAAFILSCGLGHIENVISFKWPAYHAFTVWHCFTAAASWAAVVLLIFERDIRR